MTSQTSFVTRILDAMDGAWPADVTLHFQNETSEISLHDVASALSARTLLQMCGLSYDIKRSHNTEFMSANGAVPYLTYGLKHGCSGFSEINQLTSNKGKSLDTQLSEEEHAELVAYSSMVESTLGSAELYFGWKDEQCCDEVSKPRYGSPYPWPLSFYLPYVKQKQVMSTLAARGWRDLTSVQVCEKVQTCCKALSTKLGYKPYFFGERPSSLDALVFGHLFSIVTTVLPNQSLPNSIKDFTNLQELLVRINATFYDCQLASPQRTFRTEINISI